MEEKFFFLRLYLLEGGKALLTHCRKGEPNSTLNIKVRRQYGIQGVIVEDTEGNLWRIPTVENDTAQIASNALTQLKLFFNKKGKVTKAVHCN